MTKWTSNLQAKQKRRPKLIRNTSCNRTRTFLLSRKLRGSKLRTRQLSMGVKMLPSLTTRCFKSMTTMTSQWALSQNRRTSVPITWTCAKMTTLISWTTWTVTSWCTTRAPFPSTTAKTTAASLFSLWNHRKTTTWCRGAAIIHKIRWTVGMMTKMDWGPTRVHYTRMTVIRGCLTLLIHLSAIGSRRSRQWLSSRRAG